MSKVIRRPTPRWTTLRQHPAQQRYYQSETRFNVVPAGRRSGKTELAKRRLVRRGVQRSVEGHGQFFNGRFFAAAPTRDQAKRIYWNDLKALVPPRYMASRPSETQLIIFLKNNTEIHVIGMDKPERFEGSPWDGGVLDEYGNMKEKAWMENIFPALADRKGWCDLIGVPEGRNHYYKRYKEALDPKYADMTAHHWKSAEILDAHEIEVARRMLDELSFRQEFEAEFVNFAGRAYYNFNEAEHVRTLTYNPKAPLIFCFDFNVAPGVAAVLQEQPLPGVFESVPDPSRFGYGIKALSAALKIGDSAFMKVPAVGTGVIGEVWIPQNSNTLLVCNRLIHDWGRHEGPVICYGDATGGSKGSAKVQGSDWELIEQALGMHFGSRLDFEVPDANPAERARVNAVNTRMKTMDGVVRFMVDHRCEKVIEDFEGVRTVEGGSGEIDKKRDPSLSHISDAIGYYVVREHPLLEEEVGDLAVTGLYG